jgi:hypothetical protein
MFLSPGRAKQSIQMTGAILSVILMTVASLRERARAQTQAVSLGQLFRLNGPELEALYHQA